LVWLFGCAVKFDGSGFKSCSRYALRVKIYLFSKSHKFIARYIFSSLFHVKYYNKVRTYSLKISNPFDS
jgi:hypothetical protein